MSEELEETHNEGSEINADAITEAFSDEGHDEDDEGVVSRFNTKYSSDDDEGLEDEEIDDDIDTNFEIMDSENHW